MKMTLSLFVPLMLLGLLLTACGGDENSPSYNYDTADTVLTTDQIAGMWKIDSSRIISNTCPEGDDSEQYDYMKIDKIDATQVSALSCKDVACVQADPDGASTNTFANNKIIAALPGKQLLMDLSSMGVACKIYVDIQDATSYFQSATQFTTHTAMKTIYEGSQCSQMTDDAGNPVKNCAVDAEAVFKKQN